MFIKIPFNLIFEEFRFDVNFVLENYGLKGVLVEIIFIEIINALILRDAIADPCPLVFFFDLF